MLENEKWLRLTFFLFLFQLFYFQHIQENVFVFVSCILNFLSVYNTQQDEFFLLNQSLIQTSYLSCIKRPIRHKSFCFIDILKLQMKLFSLISLKLQFSLVAFFYRSSRIGKTNKLFVFSIKKLYKKNENQKVFNLRSSSNYLWQGCRSCIQLGMQDVSCIPCQET